MNLLVLEAIQAGVLPASPPVFASFDEASASLASLQAADMFGVRGMVDAHGGQIWLMYIGHDGAKGTWQFMTTDHNVYTYVAGRV